MNHRSVIKFIGFSLIILVILFVVLRVAMTAKSVISKSSEDQRLESLTYPEPSENPEINLSFRKHLGGTNINSKWIGFGPIIDQDGNELGELLITVGTRIDGNTRSGVTQSVTMTFETTGTLRLPVSNWRQTPLILISDRTIQLETTQYTMDLANMSKEDGHTDAMAYEVPTRFFVEAVAGDRLIIRIHNLEVVVDTDYLDALRDLAAYLKPGVSP